VSNVTKLELVEVGAGYKVDVEGVLRGALEAGLDQVVVLGLDADGDTYVASSHRAADAFWLMEWCKLDLMQVGRET
jgi:hypothetical protein